MLRRQQRRPKLDTRKAAAIAPTSPADAPMLVWLRAWRAALARELGVPAYVILHDRSLRDLAAIRPATADELLQVNGIGAAKAARYGAALLAVVGASA